MYSGIGFPSTSYQEFLLCAESGPLYLKFNYGGPPLKPRDPNTVFSSADFTLGAYRDSSFGQWLEAFRRRAGYMPPGRGDEGTGGIFEADTFTLTLWGNFHFPAGQYVFEYASDDGIRVFLDGQLIVDEWRDQGVRGVKRTSPRWIAEGVHNVNIQYYENKWLAEVYFDWKRLP